MSYLGSEADIARLRELDFDHQVHGVPIQKLVSRLQTERNLFDGPLARPVDACSVLCQVVLVDAAPGKALERTLVAWMLQSCPSTDCILVPVSPDVSAAALRAWITDRPNLDVVKIAELDLLKSEWTDAEYVTFSAPGDVLHPSTGTVVATIGKTESCSIIVWNEIQLAPNFDTSESLPLKIVALMRRARFQRHTLNHINYVGWSFAVKTALLRQYKHDLLEELVRNDGHLFQLWVSKQPGFSWYTQPEFLSTRVAPRVRTAPRERILPYLSRYRVFFEEHESEFYFEESNHTQQPFRLVPRRTADSISVIIPFRDKAETTCQCLKALSTQHVSGRLEVVLVNNQSKLSSLRRIKSFVKTLEKTLSLEIVDYDKPFNHSAQCNLGIEASSGEALILLNNDALINSLSAVEEMAAWSLVPTVATVGVQITTRAGLLVCGGVLGRHALGDQTNAVAQESRDRIFAKMTRETFANTFAFAAMSRATFDKLGPLDSIRYPNGYNDVEYCLRASAVGNIHMYLGHLRAYHTPGTTRNPTDERFQKVLLRAKYPHVLQTSLFQIEEDRDYRKQLVKRYKLAPRRPRGIRRLINAISRRTRL